jgi:hypothetical protein
MLVTFYQTTWRHIPGDSIFAVIALRITVLLASFSDDIVSGFKTTDIHNVENSLWISKKLYYLSYHFSSATGCCTQFVVRNSVQGSGSAYGIST